MTYEELSKIAPGTLFRVSGCIYRFMFIKRVNPHDRTVRVEMNGVTMTVDPSQIKPLTVYDTAIIKQMYEAVFPDGDNRFNQVVEFIEKLK